MTRIGEYFNQFAHGYDKLITSSILRKWRNQELQVVLQLLKPSANDKILDAGCGTGFYTSLLVKCGADTFACDASPEMLEKLKKKLPMVRAYLVDVNGPLPGAPFNKILCAGALEFNDDPGKIIKNFGNSIELDGEVILLVPRRNILGICYWLYHYMGGMPINLFTTTDIRVLAHTAGLELKRSVRTAAFSLVVQLKKTRITTVTPH